MRVTAGASERHNVSVNASEFVLSGLASDTSYRVSLRAASRRGLGPAAVKYYMTRALYTILINYLDILQYN